jgi:hypothetical protein
VESVKNLNTQLREALCVLFRLCQSTRLLFMGYRAGGEEFRGQPLGCGSANDIDDTS